jgi:hypothetical protein
LISSCHLDIVTGREREPLVEDEKAKRSYQPESSLARPGKTTEGKRR